MFHRKKSKYILNKKTVKQYNSLRALEKRALLCHAPFKTMRFTLSGNIIACCYNRYYILGKYPGNRLHDIWFGNKIKKLQKSIRKYDLSQGCYDCHNFLCRENFFLTGALNYDYLNKIKQGYPVMLDFELFNTCNLECVQCNGENSSLIRCNREKGRPYSCLYDKNFAEQLNEFIPYLSEARFTGGEPFLIDIYYDIWDRIIRKNPDILISILTNGTMLNGRIKSMLQSGNFNISVSIDSIHKEIYEKIRQNANFDKVMDNVMWLYEFSQKNRKWFNLNFCPMQQNWQEIPDFMIFCGQKNIPVFFHTIKLPASCSLWNLEFKTLDNIHNYLSGFKFDDKTEIQRNNIRLYDGLLQQIRQWCDDAGYHKEISFEEKTIDDLKQTLFDRLKKTAENMQTEQKKSEHDKYNEILNNIISIINDDILVKQSLINLLKINPESIISEIEIDDNDRLAERFRAIR
ncbi:MAG: radical SAM protein [Bacteroidia bacterium]|nr:radical SAM protein [Bacteroidia bacterium]